MYPTALLAPVVAGAFVLALGAPLAWLAYIELLAHWSSGTWELSGVVFDISDIALAFLGAGVLFRSYGGRPLPRRLLVAWCLLAVVRTVSFVVAPVNSEYFEGFFSTGYQVYRYVLRPMIYLPLVLVLFRERRRFESLLSVFAVVGVGMAVVACMEGYRDAPIHGLLQDKNNLGGVLAGSLILVAWRLLGARTAAATAIWGTAAMIILRAMLFASSRGAFAALFVGAMVLAVAVTRASEARSQVLRLVPLAVGLLVMLVIARPEILQNRSVQRMFSVGQGLEDQNMVWRMQERWPHFWKLAVDKPWLGTGWHVDPTLHWRANTPHNGYLATAVQYGFPFALLLWALAPFALWTLRSVWKKARDPDIKLLAAALAAALMTVLVHNVVETTILQNPITPRLYMALIAGAVVLREHLQHESLLVEEPPVARVVRPRALARRPPVFGEQAR